jgi:hypothetical protein
MQPSAEYDPDRAAWPHAVMLYNAGDGYELMPYPTYGDALDALRVRAAWWEQDETGPIVDVTTASVETLSDLYATGYPEAWVALHPLEQPIIGDHAAWRIHLEWPT